MVCDEQFFAYPDSDYFDGQFASKDQGMTRNPRNPPNAPKDQSNK